MCDCVRVVQEVTVAGTGYFKALSDGTVEVLFLDGVRAQMMWKSHTHTPAQVHHACTSLKYTGDNILFLIMYQLTKLLVYLHILSGVETF